MLKGLKTAWGFIKSNNVLLGIVLTLCIGAVVNFDEFLTVTNLMNITRQAAVVGFLALGMTFVIISGSIDISVGALVPFTSFFCLYFSNYNIILALIVPLIVGCFVGAINGFLIAHVNIPPMIATYAMQLIIRGVICIITGNLAYRAEFEHPVLVSLGSGNVGIIPIATIVYTVFFIIFQYMLKQCPAFRNVFAVGANIEAARMMGINVKRTVVYVHAICGVSAGLAGIALSARTGAAVPLSGDGYEMLAIASVAIGGTFLSGGRGKMFGSFAGAFLIGGLISNIFKMQNSLSTYWDRVIIGIVMLIVLLLQVLSSNNRHLNVRKIVNNWFGINLQTKS